MGTDARSRLPANITPNGGGNTTRKVITTSPQLACIDIANTDNLADRCLLFLEAENNGVVWSFDPAMTYAHKLFKDSLIVLDVGPNVNVYLKTLAGTVNVVISERANG